MKKITVSAPGKLMLCGEHSVVYGYPCLVTAVDKRLFVEVEQIKENKDIIITPQVKENKFVREAVNCFKNKFNINQIIKVKTYSNFSHQVGLGSSSAVTAATVKALCEVFQIPLTLAEIFKLSYQVSLSIQGVGSGFDIAAAVFGKTLYYLYAGKKIEALNLDNLSLIVGYSGQKADTPNLINKVKLIYQNNPEKIKEIFQQITDLVNQAKIHLLNNNYQTLGNIFTKNHQLLQELGVSTSKLDILVKAAVDAGAWGAKLSGAGGGDCMIAIAPQNKKTLVEQTIRQSGGKIIKVNTNAQGVKIESNN